MLRSQRGRPRAGQPGTEAGVPLSPLCLGLQAWGKAGVLAAPLVCQPAEAAENLVKVTGFTRSLLSQK